MPRCWTTVFAIFCKKDYTVKTYSDPDDYAQSLLRQQNDHLKGVLRTAWERRIDIKNGGQHFSASAKR